MAKKKSATKKTAKKTSKKVAASATAKKTPSKKPAAKQAAAKKASSKKAPAKKVSTKKPAATKKAPAKKAPTTKPVSKKPTAKKPASKEAPTKKASPSKAPAAAEKKSAPAKADSKADAKPNAKADGKADGKPTRKGITIVENRSRKKKTESKFQPPPSTLGSLLAKRKRQPLIPSGPNAPTSEFSTFGEDGEDKARGKKVKSPFKKKELDKFREILLMKRRELAGDVEEMERSMASLGDRDGNPALDVAEQGSDAYDQSLSIGLAEADRKLIREIDEALRRIDEGVYGVCEVTKQPISTQRLNELPWTRLSIEAARDAERRGGGR